MLNNNMVPKFIDLNNHHSQPPPPQQQQHQQPGGYPNGTFSTSFNTQRHKKRILKFVLLWVPKSASLERVSELPRRTCQK